MKGFLGAVLLLPLVFVATAWALDCQSLGLRVAEVSLDAPIKDVVWLEGKVRNKPGPHGKGPRQCVFFQDPCLAVKVDDDFSRSGGVCADACEDAVQEQRRRSHI
jgi:hypothetical protein